MYPYKYTDTTFRWNWLIPGARSPPLSTTRLPIAEKKTTIFSKWMRWPSREREVQCFPLPPQSRCRFRRRCSACCRPSERAVSGRCGKWRWRRQGRCSRWRRWARWRSSTRSQSPLSWTKRNFSPNWPTPSSSTWPMPSKTGNIYTSSWITSMAETYVTTLEINAFSLKRRLNFSSAIF